MSAEDVVRAAREWLGTPYRHQAALRGVGCDCLGLVRGVWQELHGEAVQVPKYRADWRDTRHASDLISMADRLLLRSEGPVRAGQVIVFRLGRSAVPRHCGIALSEGRFIHAQEGLGVVESNFTEGWRRRVALLFDFPGH